MTNRIGKLIETNALNFVVCILFLLCTPAYALVDASGTEPPSFGALPANYNGGVSLLRAFIDGSLVGNQLGSDSSKAVTGLTCQSSTLLPSGGVLLLGGERGNEPVSSAYITDPISGTAVLPTGLHFARYCQTATMLPNGTVLIVGGIGADGKPVQTNESFDPHTRTFSVISTPGLAPRAFHTATLLTDGRVLIAGGISETGQLTGKFEFWDYRTGIGTQSSLHLGIPRGAHNAALQASGAVLFWGGVDANSKPLESGEIFDPATQEIQTQPTPISSVTQEAPLLAASIPVDGGQDVPLDPVIALRFTEPLLPQTLTEKTVSLKGPGGALPLKIVPAEKGMLVFIAPQQNLLPATQYELTVFDATDSSRNVLPDTVVRFTTVLNTSSLGSGIAPQSTNQSDPFNAPARKLSPLRAPKGVTAVSGQVLQLNGDPLRSTTLQIGGRSVHSDETGRFLLQNVPSGHQVMWIDGTTANHNGMTYGLYEDGVDITAAQTNVLPYTIWMTVLDTADEVTLSSPTDRETIVSTPVMPGLELHIPKGTVIKDRNDQVLTKVGITLIPVAQPPFPLPKGVNVPTYFTIQPGGAYLEGYWGGNSQSVGGRLFYPNAENLPANAPFNFWNYDADEKGWYVYGQGFVTADRKQVVPNAGVEIYEFTGAMVGNPATPPTGPNGDGPNGGDPVDLRTGLFVYTKTDLALSDVIPINLTRTYRQMDPTSRAFGIGTMSNYDIYLVGDGGTYSYINLVLADGGQVEFDRTSPGTDFYTSLFEATSRGGMYYGATITWNGATLQWTLTLKNGTKMVFPDSAPGFPYSQASLASVVDRYGNTLTLVRDSNHNLTQITSSNGRWIQCTYDSSNRVTQAIDSMGRSVSYTYDSSGRLYTVKDANGGTTTFTYDSNNNMKTIQDARGIVYITNDYDNNNMVSQQTMVDGSTYQFRYVLNGSSLTNNQATVTDPRGNVRIVNFNSDGFETSETRAYGKPEQQTMSYTRQPVSGLLLSTTDALNRTTAYAYDVMGNVTSVTALAGTPEAESESFSYNGFGDVASVTDPLGRVSTFSYDSNGNMVNLTGTDGNSASLAYNTAGQPVSSTDPLGNTTQLSYSGPDLSGITDPLSHQLTIFTDSAGRVAEMGNSLNANVQFAWSPSNQITSVTDPLGGVTSAVYDANGNLMSLTDPKNTQTPTKFLRDTMDRLQSRTDPLTNSDSRAYDSGGNLIQFIDRRGKITTYQHDGLNRLTFVGFGTQSGPTYESTISYTWDAGNRLTQVSDSIAGTTTIGYDDFNRVDSVTSPQGSVSYTYDAIGRRQTMTVAGQATVNYSYDAGDRVTQITQGSSTVQIGYDADGRRTSLTLPNNIVASYAYDGASELIGITYTQAGSAIGDLAYTYDSIGHRTTVSGSLAHTNLPQPIANAVYNADNQLTQWGTTAVTYDANGNVINDGTHAYTWDGRNHLVAVDNGGSASFSYDPFGRRISKTVYGLNTGYLYNGANVVQELSGSSPSANLLSGGVDEVFARTDSSGTDSFLRDGLGSTLALTDSAGTIQQSYAYDPYGGTSTTGNSSTNSYQFTGRETDATGLYYLRARYYNPAFGRFMSEDPIGFAGGNNIYAYVGDDPLDLLDPSGLKPCSDFGCSPNDPNNPDPNNPNPNSPNPNNPDPNNPDPNCSASPNLNNTGKRLLQAGKGVLNLSIGVGKMAGGIALAAGTDGLGAAVGYFAVVNSFGNFGAGVSQLAGAVSGDIEGGEQGAQASSVVFSPTGMTTLIATGGNLRTASTAASLEGVVLTPATAGFTGESPAWYDWADLGQNVNDLASQPGNCQ